jgi:hypothetical protein
MDTKNNQMTELCAKCQFPFGKHAAVGDFCPTIDWYSDKDRFQSGESVKCLNCDQPIHYTQGTCANCGYVEF